jgi:3D-(3,5/4)-trihydroxycyclohexane-1,2-dione acylhydrolase (decyclizing)
MSQLPRTVRLTRAQAPVRHLAHQLIEIDGIKQRLCSCGFGIFGHGNGIFLGEAPHQYKAQLPLRRGQSEQSMALATANGRVCNQC